MKYTLFLITALILSLLAHSVYAQMIIIPPPPPPHPPPRPPRPPRIPPRQIVPLYIERHHVEVKIDNQAANTKIDQIFTNENPMILEGEYIFPLPDDASVSSFAMYIDGKRVKAELLTADKARKIYEDIVRKSRDPALLEYIGRRAFRARIFPIPANGEKRVQLEYSQVLKADAGIVKYVYPLNTEKFSPRPVNDVAVTVKIESRQAIKSVYSPSHKVDVQRKDDHHATIGYEGSDVKADRDFVCYYTLSEKDFGIDMMAHRDDDKNGYFMLLVAPKQGTRDSDVLKKDIIFVFDKSGSMSGEKIKQAKEALLFCVRSLNEGDKFNLIAFSTEADSLSENLLAVNPENRQKAMRFIDELDAAGGTNINEALLTALKEKTDAERPRMIVFLTDGKPTVGETEIGTIVKNVQKSNDEKARLFVFGVGYDVNTILLDKLSEENRGTSQYVEPKEDIEVAISSFYTKVSKPVLANLKIDTGSIKTKDIYPRTLPDLFRGSQLVLLGRYADTGETVIKLTGEVNGKKRTFEDEVTFPKHSDEHDFLPRLWAQRKVAYLADEIRLHGEDKELKDEIVRLGKKYGLVTPYTSFLVQEDEPLAVRAPRRGGRVRQLKREDRLGRQARAYSDSDKYNSAGGGIDVARTAVQESKKLQAMKQSKIVASPGEIASEKIKRVSGKTFYLKDNFWVDSEYTEKTKTKDIEYGSDKYFKLLREYPELGKYFAIGTRVIVCYKGKCYRVKEG